MDRLISSYQEIIYASIPVYLFIAGGYGFRKWGWLTKSADESFIRLQIRVFYPALIFSLIYGNESLIESGSILLAPALGFLSILLGLAIAFMLAKLLRLEKGKGKRTFIFSTSVYNYGFIAIPLAQALFEDPAVMGTLVVFNAGVEVAIWTIGIVVLSGGFRRESLKNAINPPLLALVLAMFLNFTLGKVEASGEVLNEVFLSMTHAMKWLGSGAIPFALILIGASIRDLLEAGEIETHARVSFGAPFARMLLIPLAFLCTASLLDIPWPLKAVLIIQAAMPCGMFPIILSRHYGGKPSIAAQIVIVTTLLSFFTIPIWISIGKNLVGIS